jgi:uncharacterized protein
MWFVFAFFFVSYGALHAYLFLKVRRAFDLSRAAVVALAVFLLAMFISIILIRVAERADHVTAARLLGLIGYPWVALIFWFCVLEILSDAWNLAMRISAKAVPFSLRLVFPTKPTLCVLGAVVTLAALFGLIEANRIGVREIRLQTSLLPKGSAPIRLAQISDLHLSIHRGPRLLRHVLDLLNEIKPNAILSTGDLVDSDFPHIEDLAKSLSELNPPLGKFAVLGNHEYYWRENASLAFHRLAGFRILRQDAARIAPAVVLAGVDDGAGRYTRQTCLDDEDAALDLAPRDSFVILLKHQPLVSENSIDRFDLQLSGHLHGGQIFPFQLAIRFLYPYLAGVHRLGSRSLLNVSRGVGTWGPSMRLRARPEICLITLEPAVR